MTTLAFPVDPNDARLREPYLRGRRATSHYETKAIIENVESCARGGWYFGAAYWLGVLHARYLPPMTDDTTEEE